MKKNVDLKNKTEKLSFLTDNFFAKFFSGWFVFGFVSMLLYNGAEIDLTFSDIVNPVVCVMIIVFVFLILSVVDHKLKKTKITPIIFVISLFAFSAELLCRLDSIYVYLALAVFFMLAVKYMCSKEMELRVNMSKKLSIAFVCLVTVFFAHVTIVISVLRYETYAAPNYDFGIFCNMYYNMKKTLLPNTTCERDMLLSHFSVHISPILYLLLPIYAVFSSPVTIAVLQVLIVYSGIIPLYLIAKKYKLSDGIIAVVAVIYAAYPALCANCTFDFHENCFLTPLLLWMIFFYEKGNTSLMFVFAVLTLMVKEDAAVYVAVFGIYIIVANKHYEKGVALTAGSVLWFFIATTILANYGDGVMINRYSNLINGDEGVFGIVKTILLNPGYAVSEIFTTEEDTTDKVLYSIQIFLPLAFVPFCTKKFSRCILILPVFLNLLSGYIYQYQISYQYSFGISAFLMYVTVMNIADEDGEKKRVYSVSAAGLSVLMSLMMFVPTYTGYIEKYTESKELYDEMDDVLESIPEDKSVVATAFIVPHVSEHMEVYELEFHDEINTDYLVVDMRPTANDYSEYVEEYEDNGYVLVAIVLDGIYVYASSAEAANMEAQGIGFNFQ